MTDSLARRAGAITSWLGVLVLLPMAIAGWVRFTESGCNLAGWSHVERCYSTSLDAQTWQEDLDLHMADLNRPENRVAAVIVGIGIILLDPTSAAVKELATSNQLGRTDLNRSLGVLV